jgi:predicted methyltransferase
MNKLLFASVLSMSVVSAACKKQESPPKADPVATPTPTPTAKVEPAVDAGPSDTEKVAAAMKKADDEAAAEKTRWTPELEKQAVALRDAKYPDAKAALTAMLASPHRMPTHKDRDAARHPVETLAFFGMTPTMTVVELGAGGGWYTELLAPVLAPKGKLIVAGPATEGPADKMSTVYGKRLDQFLAKSPALFGKVERMSLTDGGAIKIAPDASADLVLSIREIHNWQRDGKVDAYLAAVHAALKDGGTFGVVAHRAAVGTKGEDTAKSGYLAEDWVIERVKAGGFELVEKSEINANPKDTKDYVNGVWTLPPNLREGDKDRAKYQAIGESDRMTLKFKKVTKK